MFNTPLGQKPMDEINHQSIQKQDLKLNGILQVHSFFRTIQGEGPFAGRPAIFIRLAGCNLRCPFCDTEYEEVNHRLPSIEMVSRVWKLAGNSVNLVVITGGEPFRQDIGPLVCQLRQAGFEVQIETNGTLYLPSFPYYDRVTIVCSPKTAKINPALIPFIDAIKYVMETDDVNIEDGLPSIALGHPAKPHVWRKPDGHGALVYLQPLDSQDEEANRLNQIAVVNSCLKYGYTLCLQIHKIINVE